MSIFVKALPRGVNHLILGKTLRELRDRYDVKEWGEYKVELNRNDGVVSYVLRYPTDPKIPFRVVTADCSIVHDAESMYETPIFRLSFFYRTEVKQELGEELLVQEAIKKYGHSPKLIASDAGFYKRYRWEDAKTRIDLGLGFQYDRLFFVDTAQGDMFVQSSHERQKIRAYRDLF